MVGGGLIQLVAYGAAPDLFINNSSNMNFFEGNYKINKHKHEYDVNECMTVKNITERRTYRNFKIQQINWYQHGNASFTVNKYKELNEKYNNLEFITMNFNNMLDFKIEKGNKTISEKLKEQNKIAKQLREQNREIDRENEKQKKMLVNDETLYKEECKKYSNGKKVSRHHKRFFNKK